MDDIIFDAVRDCAFLAGMLFGLHIVCFRWPRFRARYGTMDLFFWLLAYTMLWGAISIFAALAVSIFYVRG